MRTGLRKETKAEANRFDGKAYFTGRFDGDERGRYLILWGGDVRRKIVGIGTSELCHGRDVLDVLDVDGNPTTVMRCTERYEKAVVVSATANEAYSLLADRFAECDVRWLFPELWIAWKNAKAKKDRRREEHDYLEARRHGGLKRKTRDEKTIRGWTQRCDIRDAARRYGSL